MKNIQLDVYQDQVETFTGIRKHIVSEKGLKSIIYLIGIYRLRMSIEFYVMNREKLNDARPREGTAGDG